MVVDGLIGAMHLTLVLRRDGLLHRLLLLLICERGVGVHTLHVCRLLMLLLMLLL